MKVSFGTWSNKSVGEAFRLAEALKKGLAGLRRAIVFLLHIREGCCLFW